ncbi:hypothetical protein F5Y11DRAFT_319033 [Daldinia sp. FL1419]|nr:hypothetical protein F5Y11DRAFT_319033 [Daldinia sp. FL1419]
MPFNVTALRALRAGCGLLFTYLPLPLTRLQLPVLLSRASTRRATTSQTVFQLCSTECARHCYAPSTYPAYQSLPAHCRPYRGGLVTMCFYRRDILHTISKHYYSLCPV